MTISEGLEQLKKYGLDSIPGGGAEIFDEEIRKKICPEKTSAERWLEIYMRLHIIWEYHRMPQCFTVILKIIHTGSVIWQDFVNFRTGPADSMHLFR